LRKADLTEAFLPGANLAEAQASGVEFFRCDLTNANFQKAMLRNVNFRDAHLDGAKFAGADLGIAILRETDLQNVDLSDVDLSTTLMHRVGCEEAGRVDKEKGKDGIHAEATESAESQRRKAKNTDESGRATMMAIGAAAC